jgi:TolB protein
MKPHSRTTPKAFRFILGMLVGISLIALGWIYLPRLFPQAIPLPGIQLPQIRLPAFKSGNVQPGSQTQAFTNTPQSVNSSSVATSTPSIVPIYLQNNGSPEENLRAQGVLVIAMRDGQFIHLFAYHPLYLPLTRLTNAPWDDMTPSISPDGTRLIYASRRNGYWDLYILELATGQVTRLTDTPEYEASPTWSPDGQWIAYERYNGISLDIYIQSLADPTSTPIQLTDDPGIDRSPAWSPQGREIAFVSTRSGDEDIWLARLDDVDHRFVNISHNPLAQDRSPAWSLDGSLLAWASEQGGDRRLAVWNKNTPETKARLTGDGDRPAWSPDNNILFSEVREPSGSGLAAYMTADGRLSLPYTPLPGTIYGLTWVKGPLPAWLISVLNNPDQAPAPTLWQSILTRTVAPAGRIGLVPLPDVTAPHAMLQDGVDEAFNALRQQIAEEMGWDALSSLENAYMPLTSPPNPSIQDDWLYTGRAFAVNPLVLNAGWMAITREDFSGQTYWRVYLKARYQDGSMGMPVTEQTWDLNARFNGDTRAYEQGGRLGSAVTGYWIDLTELAGRYNWQRLPAWNNWRSFYPAIRFNQFVITDGLAWRQAMDELYPPEALATSTPLPSFTPTQTETPEFTPRPATETPTPTLTSIPTHRPTWTPLATQPAP